MINLTLATVTLAFLVLPTFALDETKVVSSAEQITVKWENLLSGGINLVWFAPKDKYWAVYRHTLVPGSLAYDVRKTDSLVSPYTLVVSFQAKTLNNTYSPNANGIIQTTYSTKEKGGYKSAEDALANVTPEDFMWESLAWSKLFGIPLRRTPESAHSRDMNVNYALQKDTWVLKGGNDHFNTYIGRHLRDNENGYLFTNIIAAPAQ